MELLRQGNDAAAAGLAASRPGRSRSLVHRLWDASPTVRATAARALGTLAATDPARGRELARRLLWALNDESGTNAAAVLPALEATAARRPALLAAHLGALAALTDDEGLRDGLLRVFEAIAGSDAGALADHADTLAAVLSPSERVRYPRLAAILDHEGREPR